MRRLIHGMWVLVMVGGTALAQPVDGEHFAAARKFRREVMEKLGLSPEQKRELRRLHEVRRPTAMALGTELRALHEQLAAAMVAATSDAELRALHAKVVGKRQELAALRFEGLLEMRKILTPEQRRKFVELRPFRHGLGPGGFGHAPDEAP